MAEHSSRTTEGKGRLPEQNSGEVFASTSGRSSASKLPRPEAQLTAREAAPDTDPKVAMATERSASASAASHFPLDEQRLLARANACSGKLILAARARCLNTLLSAAAHGLPLCWPRLTTRTCCNRGAHAESPAIQRRSAERVGDLITVLKEGWRDIRDDRDSRPTAIKVSRAADDIS